MNKQNLSARFRLLHRLEARNAVIRYRDYRQKYRASGEVFFQLLLYFATLKTDQSAPLVHLCVKTVDQPEAEYDLLMLKTVVNPKGSGANRFLMVEVAINPLLDFSSEFDKMNPMLTSLSGEYFSSKTVEELSEVKNRELFKRELAEQINRYTKAETGNNLVYELYFVQFIMQ